MKKAEEFELQGKFLHAVQIYNSIISSDTAYKMAYVRLANLYDRMDKFEAAFSLLKKFVENYPDDKEVRLFLGQIYLKRSFWSEAIDVLTHIFPEEQPIVSFLLGYAYYMMKDFEIARLNFENFLLNNNNAEFQSEALIHIAKICIELEKYDESLKYAEKSEVLSSTNWELHFVYGKIFYLKGMFFHSVNAFQKAISLNSGELSLYEWIGKAYLKLGDYLNAEKYFLECISGSEATSVTYSYLGVACLNARKVEEAKNYFNMALNLDPENEMAIEGKKKCNSEL